MNRAYSFRRIIFETTSALHAGSGESDPVQDMPIQFDANGLPSINATSIAGVLCHLGENTLGDLFGNQQQGSRVSFSDAAILDETGKAVVGLVNADHKTPSDYLKRVKRVWLRDHCAINALGAAKRRGKFDRTVLLAGIRFVFEFCVNASSCKDAKAEADHLAALCQRVDFQLGGGTRNGFGRIKVLRVTGREYDLNDAESREAYLRRSSSLAEDPGEPKLPLQPDKESKIRTIILKPEDFWLFSDGTGQGDLDIRPKVEQRVKWGENGPEFFDAYLLPATSIKGALRHRTAYHYNRLCGRFADKITDEEWNQPNAAVLALFGSAKGDGSPDNPGSVGRVLISDIYCEDSGGKVFNHVSIDRFTGGALDGALFTELVGFGGTLRLEVIVEPAEQPDENEEKYMQAFEEALCDLQKGWLPLGGGTMRGLGAMCAVKQ